MNLSVSATADGRPSPRRPPCRRTPLHLAVYNLKFEVVAELLVYGADLALQDRDGYHCAAPHSRPTAQPRARRDTPKRLAERREKLAEYEAAERQVPFACVGVPALASYPL